MDISDLKKPNHYVPKAKSCCSFTFRIVEPSVRNSLAQIVKENALAKATILRNTQFI